MDEELKKNILKTGTSIVGIVCKDGIVMAGDRKATAGNITMSKNECKISEVNDYLIFAGTGTASDLVMLKKLARAELRLKELKSKKRPTVKEGANLIGMLAYNVFVYGDDALSGSNQFILLLGGAVAAIVGFLNKVTYRRMIEEVADNIKSTTGAILILLFVGALAGTWLISGVIPTMIYYGLKLLQIEII